MLVMAGEKQVLGVFFIAETERRVGLSGLTCHLKNKKLSCVDVGRDDSLDL